jgi:hypothetical protein
MQSPETVWAVVEVWRGIPVAVDIFRTQEMAIQHEQHIRERINLMEDETGVFEAKLEPRLDA